MKDISLSGDQDIDRQGIRKTGDQDEYAVRFETLWVWKKAHQLMVEIHQLCRTLPKHEYFKLRNQLEKSSSSIPDNIAEGYSSYYYSNNLVARYEEVIRGINGYINWIRRKRDLNKAIKKSKS